MNASRLTLLALALVTNAGCGDHATRSSIESHMDPHPIPSIGPYFEGWYLRVTSERRTLGGLVASYRSPSGQQDQSYIATFDQPIDTAALRVEETLSAAVPVITSRGRPVVAPPNPNTPARFRWIVENLADVSESAMSITRPDGSALRVSLGSPVLWGDSIDEGPEGPWQDNPRLKGHWFVHSFASPARWSITAADGSTDSGTGLAHFEKNWGAAFPSRWVWAQGIDPKTGMAFVIAGGENPLLPDSGMDAWIVGARLGDRRWHFATGKPGQIVSAEVDACSGRLTVDAAGPLKGVAVTLTAPTNSFSPMLAPTPSGFASRSVQSFIARAQVSIAERLGPFESEPTRTMINNSALEFGGDWRCQ